MSDGQTKQFGKSQRVVPADKAQKWYPVDDQSQPKKVSTPYEQWHQEKRGGYTTGKDLPGMIATIAWIFLGCTVTCGRRAVREPTVNPIFRSCANRISSGEDLAMAIGIIDLNSLCDMKD